MTEQEKAAVIGYWRMGATTQHIASVMVVPFWIIDNIIEGYQEKHTDKPFINIKSN